MNESVIFNAAVKLPKEQRPEFLDAACAGDPRLRAEVEGLLKEHDTADSFLARPAANPPATDLFRPITEGPGTIIGPYKLLQQIGEGGFGVVYMAEQQRPVRRKVALKIIKPGMDTREVIARFESERQALALMDHPNIARVLDAGATESGRPYFVMELVKGVPITEYCDKNALPTDKRLALFITVCHAIQHAHQKGVIHRDLKPSNVMVTLHDGQPVPKVIDFGVSKATSQQLTEKTLFTAYGQMIGTPAYMSPEQAEMSGLDIDTRSDTYSLGVLLYELLTGTTPFDGKRLREAGYIEMQRIIREEAPPRPSTRVSTLGEALTVLSNQRSTDPKKLGQLLRGDLDVIVMKSLEKERSRRYDTPNAFAEDIQRFLSHEAIVARPASAAYRLKKFAERNKAGVAAISAIVAALLLGTTISTWLAIRESRASRLADVERQKADAERQKAESSLVEAVAAKSDAERERDRAEKAIVEESNQRQLALEQKQAAEAAQQVAEKAQQVATAERSAAVQERDRATAATAELARQKEYQRRLLYVAQMGLIQKAWDSDNVNRVQELLNASRPRPGEADLRGIEWHYWQRMLHQEERSFKLPIRLSDSSGTPTFGLSIFTGSATTLPQLQLLSHDGLRLATIQRASAGWGLQVWNTELGGSVPIFSTPLPAITTPAVETPARGFRGASPPPPYSIEFLDSQRVVVARDKQGSRGRNPADRTSLAVRELLTYSLDAPREQTPAAFTVPGDFTFSRDGSLLAAFTSVPGEGDLPSQPTIVILDGRTGAEVDRMPCPFRWARVLALSAGAARLVVAEIRNIRVPAPFFGPGGPGGTDGPGGFRGLGESVILSSDGLGEMAILDRATRGAVTMPAPAAETAPQSEAMSEVQSRVSEFQSRMQLNTLACQFTSDATRLAIVWRSSPRDVTTKLLDVATGREITSSTSVGRLSRGAVASALRRDIVEFSPDGKWLVSTALVDSDTFKLTLWDVAAGKPWPGEIKGHTSPPRLAAFSADSARLLVADEGGAVKVWRIPPPAAAPLPAEAPPTGGFANSFASRPVTLTSPDGRWLADSPSGLLMPFGVTQIPPPPYEIHLRDTTGQQPPKTLSFSHPISRSLQFSPDSTLLAAISVDQTGPIETAAELTVWNVATGKQISLPLARFAPSERTGPLRGRGASGGRGAPPKAKSQESAKVEGQNPPAATAVRYVGAVPLALSPDSRRLACIVPAATRDAVPAATRVQVPELRLWDLENRRQVPVSLPDRTRPGTPVFSPDSKLLLNNSIEQIQVLDAATGAFLWQKNARVSSPVFSADSSHLAGIVESAAGRSGGDAPQRRSIVVWDAVTREETGPIPLPPNGDFDSLQLSHDAGRVAARGLASVAVYDVATQTTLYSLDGRAGSLEFTRDGQRIITSTLATAQSPGFSGRGSRGSPGFGGPPFSGSGAPPRGLAQETKVWDAFTGQELLSISPQSSPLLFTEMLPGRAQRLAPLAPQAEAESLVDWLAAADADGRFLSRSQIIERIKADPSLSDEVRAIALRLVAELRRTGANNQALQVVRSTGAAREAYEFALETINEIVDQSPEFALFVTYQGIAHYRLGHYEAALASLERAQKLYAAATPIADLFAYLTMTHHQLGHADEARKFFYLYDRIATRANLRGSTATSREEAVEDGNRAQTEANATAASELRREVAALVGLQSTFLLIARASFLRDQQAEYDQAIAQLDEAIAIDPENPSIYVVRARAWWGKLDYDRMFADCNKVLDLTPDSDLAYNLRGIAYRETGKSAQAIVDFSRALEIQPRNDTYLRNRAAAYHDQGDLDKALADYTRVLEMSPNDIRGYRGRALVWSEKQESDQALNDLNKALSLNANDADSYAARSIVRQRRGEYELARSDADTAVRLGPNLPLGYRARARLLASCPDDQYRNGEQAVADATKACELTNWKFASNLATLAAAHAETRNFKEAIKFAEMALPLAAPDYRPIYESQLALYHKGQPYREPRLPTPEPSPSTGYTGPP